MTERLKRVFDIDISVCPLCGGALRVIADVTDAHVIQTILAHLKQRAPPGAAHRQTAQNDLYTDLIRYSYFCRNIPVKIPILYQLVDDDATGRLQGGSDVLRRSARWLRKSEPCWSKLCADRQPDGSRSIQGDRFDTSQG